MMCPAWVGEYKGLIMNKNGLVPCCKTFNIYFDHDRILKVVRDMYILINVMSKTPVLLIVCFDPIY